MPRPRKDGTPARAPNRRNLSELLVRKLKPEEGAFCVWDTRQRGLALMVQPTGHKAWKCVYSRNGAPRWLHVGDAAAIGLADARRLAARAMLEAAEGKDPVADRKAQRTHGGFAELAARYVETYAKRKNKSWRQAERLVRRSLLPHWGKLKAADITRVDVKAMMARIEAPVLANQTLAAASAIFAWAIREDILKANPCAKVERNEVHSRERVLSDGELPRFWAAFDAAGLVKSSALKMILLTGQRPGEVAHMRSEHIVDGWWELPGAPIPELAWPGTKNDASHRVWLPAPALTLLAELDVKSTGFVWRRAVGGLDEAMRKVCSSLGVERATPHDLRRTHGSAITRLGYGRDAMNRIQNHREGGIATVYDRHGYAEENKRIMEAVAAHIVRLAENRAVGDNVVQLR
jgi:integrase